ncbi:hypothetical protein V4C53_47675, partial [Paraburkholderia azotifigens]|uniref:hypothetical protein n=1 Tax=Paraburkholderia azotifigens TaxID=2057004 RepID=UPI0031718173
MESPLGFAWNACSLCRGTDARFAWNTQSGFVNSVKDVSGHFQTGFCGGFFDQFTDQTDAAENYASTGSS